ncbi:hypothetical protein EYC84_008621 [Monilinia fructicola]|nr:hypothetical protein EYC84_008621 [Monilinia fructicola]
MIWRCIIVNHATPYPHTSKISDRTHSKYYALRQFRSNIRKHPHFDILIAHRSLAEAGARFPNTLSDYLTSHDITWSSQPIHATQHDIQHEKKNRILFIIILLVPPRTRTASFIQHSPANIKLQNPSIPMPTPSIPLGANNLSTASLQLLGNKLVHNIHSSQRSICIPCRTSKLSPRPPARSRFLRGIYPKCVGRGKSTGKTRASGAEGE